MSELPGMWEEADLSGGWADTDGMSAKDQALDLLEKLLPREHAKAYRELFSKKFDAHAHELAEKLMTRARQAPDPHGRYHSFMEVARVLIAEIDPQKERAVVPEETVTIPKVKYNDLVRDGNRLAALEAAGVDNWEGYSHAMRILHGDED